MCASTGSFASDCPELAELASDEFLTAPEDALFTVSPVFPLGFERPSPSFESITCDACGESVLDRIANSEWLPALHPVRGAAPDRG